MSSNLSHLKDSGLPWVLGMLPRSPPRDSFWEPLNKKKTAAVIAVRVPNGRDLLPASPGQGEKLPPLWHRGLCPTPGDARFPGRAGARGCRAAALLLLLLLLAASLPALILKQLSAATSALLHAARPGSSTFPDHLRPDAFRAENVFQNPVVGRQHPAR